MSGNPELPLKEVVAKHSSNPTETLYDHMGSMGNEIPEVDVLLVGAGFGSFTLMNRYDTRGIRTEDC
jgi:hypothetical protein